MWRVWIRNLCAGLLSALAASACAHQRTGQIDYFRTMNDGKLNFIEEFEASNEGGSERPVSTVIEKGKPVAIILKRAFIRYLRTFHDNGEVAVVVTTSEFGEEGKPRLIEFFEDQRQASTLNFRDTLIYGPKEWNGTSLRITIQLIEIDARDNPMMSSYLRTVAGAARTAFPHLSPAIGIVSSIGEFLVKEVGKDDKELAFHFTLYNDQGADPNVPTLRSGAYVAIKQEWGRSVVEFGPTNDDIYSLKPDESDSDWFHLSRGRFSIIDPVIHAGRFLLGLFLPNPLSPHVTPHNRIWDRPNATAPDLVLQHGDLMRDGKPFRARTFVVFHVTDKLMGLPESVLTYMEQQAKRYEELLKPDLKKAEEVESMAKGFANGLRALSLARDAQSIAGDSKASDLAKSVFEKRLCEFSLKAYEEKDASNLDYLLRIIGSTKTAASNEPAVKEWEKKLKKKPENCSS